MVTSAGFCQKVEFHKVIFYITGGIFFTRLIARVGTGAALILF